MSAFILLFSVIGIALIGFATHSIYQSMSAQNWPTTEAVLDSVKLIEEYSDGASYQVDVNYTYSVSGQIFSGNRLAFGYGGSGNKKAHQDIFNELKDASKILVRFDPKHPSESTLTYGLNKSSLIMLCFGIVWTMFIFGFGLLFFLFGQSDSALIEQLRAACR